MASHKQRVERLEGPQATGALIIVGQPGESAEDAVQRHLVDHPQDADREMIIITSSANSRDPIEAARGAEHTTSGKEESQRPLTITK